MNTKVLGTWLQPCRDLVRHFSVDKNNLDHTKEALDSAFQRSIDGERGKRKLEGCAV